MTLKNNKPEIYLISPNKILNTDFLDVLNKLLSEGIVKVFQLRIKKCKETYLNELVKAIKPICKSNNVLFLLNDNLKIAKINDLDGVHVGELDASINKCRQLLGKNKIVGKSCYNSPTLAAKAQKSGADYIAFGSFFKTKTKEKVTKVNIKDIMYCKKNLNKPIVGIGGINQKNILKLKKLNLDYIAISSYVWETNMNPKVAIKKIKNIIDNY